MTFHEQMQVTLGPDVSRDGAIYRVVWWHAFGLMWRCLGAVYLARTRSPSHAAWSPYP